MVLRRPPERHTKAFPTKRKGFHHPIFITIPVPNRDVMASDITVDKKLTPLRVGDIANTAWNQMGSQ